MSIMKRDTLPLVYSLILLSILVIGFTFLPAAGEAVTVSVKYDPKKIDLALPPPEIVEAIIRVDDPYSVKDIDPDTILLEGSVPPLGTYFIPGGLVAEFDGQTVVNLIWAKIYHLGIVEPNPLKPYKIPLTITGSFYDGTPFSGTGYIWVKIPTNPPPP
jgi:hypothetical protein